MKSVRGGCLTLKGNGVAMTDELSPERKREIARQVKARIREIDRKIYLDSIRRKGEEFQQRRAELRRTQERIAVLVFESNWRDARRKGNVPLDLVRRRQRHMLETNGIILDRLAPKYHAHIAALVAKHKISWSQEANHMNAYAFTRSREIETCPIRTAGGYAAALH
jgi:hypothetical protein